MTILDSDFFFRIKLTRNIGFTYSVEYSLFFGQGISEREKLSNLLWGSLVSSSWLGLIEEKPKNPFHHIRPMLKKDYEKSATFTYESFYP